MNMLDLLAKRRDAVPHSEEELKFLANGAANGTIPDYQLSAWLMAAVLNPLTPEETALLTMAMARSGETLDLSSLPKPWVDKHSTGGVGDKTTLVLLPLLAACGLTVVKMSGRGLGITGGTVDKLESVPGFRMDLSPDQLLEQARKIGLAITGQTPALAPADKALYALRDATATVASVPLIVSSILSKKIAGGAETIVLDVKCGSGAFMPHFDAAEALAKALKDVAERCGLNLRLAITDMSQPLGRAVGNALEVREALEVLNGDLSGRFPALCIELAGLTLFAAGRASTPTEGKEQAHEALKRGHALEKAVEWFVAQGAKDRVVRSLQDLPQATVIEEMIYAGSPGWVNRVDARTVGQAALDLGAGRRTKADKIDPAVGVEVLKPVGSPVESGIPVFRIHAASKADAQDCVAKLSSGFAVSKERVPSPPLILETI